MPYYSYSGGTTASFSSDWVEQHSLTPIFARSVRPEWPYANKPSNGGHTYYARVVGTSALYARLDARLTVDEVARLLARYVNTRDLVGRYIQKVVAYTQPAWKEELRGEESSPTSTMNFPSLTSATSSAGFVGRFFLWWDGRWYRRNSLSWSTNATDMHPFWDEIDPDKL